MTPLRSTTVALALALLALPVSAAPPDTVVATRAGSVRGAGGEVLAFKGIPYGVPPLGPRRWRAPEPAAPWPGVRDASRFGHDCEQLPYVIPTGQEASEDCLTINVWTAARSRNGHRPVMVFVYGGAFIGGSGAYPVYDGAQLASHGVVVVSFNYRVGIFGFLAHPMLTAESAAHASGNYGLLDQIAALKWVKENIAAFGGDPAQVTVFGESAGAVSIALLMTSPLAPGLFSQAVMQSPVVPPLATLAAAEKSGAALAADIGTLRSWPVPALLAHNGDFMPVPPHAIFTPPLPAPILDGYALPAQPRDVFAAGAVRPMPTIVGISADEGRMFAMPQTVEGYRAWVQERFGPLAPGISKLYPATSDAEATTERSTILGDAMFGESARLIARGVARHEKRTFAYVFSRGIADRKEPATHSEELPFVFGTLKQPSFIPHGAPDARDFELSSQIMRMWTRFAATGNPNGPGLPAWPEYSSADPYLGFGAATAPGSAYRKALFDAFESFYADGQP